MWSTIYFAAASPSILYYLLSEYISAFFSSPFHLHTLAHISKVSKLLSLPLVGDPLNVKFNCVLRRYLNYDIIKVKRFVFFLLLLIFLWLVCTHTFVCVPFTWHLNLQLNMWVKRVLIVFFCWLLRCRFVDSKKKDRFQWFYNHFLTSATLAYVCVCWQWNRTLCNLISRFSFNSCSSSPPWIVVTLLVAYDHNNSRWSAILAK